MVSSILLFLAGVAILLVATQFFVKLASKLSSAFKISPLIIGTTVVAIGTSLPEIAISVTALATSDRNLALGNIIGSNVINVFLILAVAIFVSDVRVGTKKTQTNTLVLLVATALFLFFQIIGFPNVISGFILLLSAFVITYIEYNLGLLGGKLEDFKLFQGITAPTFSRRDVFELIFSLIGIVVGGIMTVKSTQSLSLITGITTTTLGLSLTAIATSLPELLLTLQARNDRAHKLAIGNVIGSNLYNILIAGGIINLFSSSNVVNLVEVIFLSLATLMFFFIVRWYKGTNIPNYMSYVLLVLFLVYLLAI